jgi:DNA-binding response OmpR family regulator
MDDRLREPQRDPRLPLRVLLAEDDEAVRVLIATVLKRAGFAVDLARNGAEAIEKLDASDYDAILLDLNMPMVSGFEVIAHLEQRDPDRLATSVIVLTAVSDAVLRRIEGKRVFRIIRKPFDLSELVSTVIECSCSRT